MSLRFGSGWLAIYFLICSCTFRCSAPQSRARDYTTFNPSPPLQGRAALTVEVTRPRGRPASRCCVGLFRIPKGLKCVERRGAGRGAGVHAPQAEFTFRTYCRQPLPNRVTSGLLVTRGQSPGSTNQICGPSRSLVRRTIPTSTLQLDRCAWPTTWLRSLILLSNRSEAAGIPWQ
jgi:hypothetical protein